MSASIRRREVITLLGGAAAWPLVARAQQAGKVHRIGFLGSATAAGSANAVESLRTGLRDFGYVEGTNIVIEFRWAEGIYDRLPRLVAELIATNVDVLITHGTPGTRVAKQATTTIPIVMAISGDAIATGLVSSLARPQANLTGSTFFLPQLNAKRLEVLKEALDRPPAQLGSQPQFPRHWDRAARAMTVASGTSSCSTSSRIGREVVIVKAARESEFDAAFSTMAQARAGALLVGGGAFFVTQRRRSWP